MRLSPKQKLAVGGDKLLRFVITGIFYKSCCLACVISVCRNKSKVSECRQPLYVLLLYALYAPHCDELKHVGLGTTR